MGSERGNTPILLGLNLVLLLVGVVAMTPITMVLVMASDGRDVGRWNVDLLAPETHWTLDSAVLADAAHRLRDQLRPVVGGAERGVRGQIQAFPRYRAMVQDLREGTRRILPELSWDDELFPEYTVSDDRYGFKTAIAGDEPGLALRATPSATSVPR